MAGTSSAWNSTKLFTRWIRRRSTCAFRFFLGQNFANTKGAVKVHTLLDLRGPIPSFIRITSGKIHDVNILDEICPEPGAFYVMDRAYLDFTRLFRLHQSLSFFVIRPKSNFDFRRVYSHACDKTTGVRCDQTISLEGYYPKLAYPEHLRRIKYLDIATGRRLAFLTNNFALPAPVIAQLYRCRWHVELFFKWIKQHLRIKKFYGTSENAVKTQIWIAVSIYVLEARRHREDRKCKCGVYFAHGNTVAKINATVS